MQLANGARAMQGKRLVQTPRTRSAGRGGVAARAAADRPVWCVEGLRRRPTTTLPGATPPAHLKGTIAGDRGFDPLSLGVEPERLKWYTEAELYNGRWAMAGVFGIIHQEAMGKAGLIKDIPWFNTGYELKDEFPIAAQLGVLFPLFGFLELTRYEGFKKTGECGVINMFPFDPLGMKSEKMKEREVKNGRLAMMAFVGFVVQAVVCRQGPLDCMYAHIADPFNNNILTNIVSPAGATYPGM